MEWDPRLGRWNSKFFEKWDTLLTKHTKHMRKETVCTGPVNYSNLRRMSRNSNDLLLVFTGYAGQQWQAEQESSLITTAASDWLIQERLKIVARELSVRFQRSLSIVQGSFQRVSRKLKGYFESVSKMLKRMFKRCLKKVWSLFQKGIKGVSREFQGVFK